MKYQIEEIGSPMLNDEADIVLREEMYGVMGACFEVYKSKGCGFLEDVYQECLEIEFAHLNIPFVSKPKLELEHRGQKLRKAYEPDFVCYGKVIVELKAAKHLADENRAQVLNYLKATQFEVGLLVNFGSYPKLQWERLVRSFKFN
ncbi:MAG: GxxExxY protein [Verrucomicrobiota bacterium]